MNLERTYLVAPLFGNEGGLWRSLGRPDRYAHAEPAARAPPPEVMLAHVRGGVGLQLDRTKIVTYKPAGVEPALPLIAGNRSREVAVAVGYGSELPFAELLGCREVNVDEIRITAVEAERSRARRNLRLVGDVVELDAIDDIRGQIPAIGRIAQREALIERCRTPRHWLTNTGIGAESITEAKTLAEGPRQLTEK